MERETMDSLAMSVALELLSRDGARVIWQAHVTAAKVYRDCPPAAEILLRIADAAEETVRRKDLRLQPIKSIATSGTPAVGRNGVNRPAGPFVVAHRQPARSRKATPPQGSSD